MEGSVLILAKTAAQRDWLCTLARQALPALAPTTQAFPLSLVSAHTRLLLADMDGTTLAQRQRLFAGLQQQQLTSKTLLFSARLENALLQRALDCDLAGYLLTSQSLPELYELLTHPTAMPPLFAPAIWQHLLAHFRTAPPAHTLTQRECDVLAAIGDGLTIARTAARLALSESTVASYVKQIYRKLGIRNRAQAAQAAMQLGLLRPEQRP